MKTRRSMHTRKRKASAAPNKKAAPAKKPAPATAQNVEDPAAPFLYMNVAELKEEAARREIANPGKTRVELMLSVMVDERRRSLGDDPISDLMEVDGAHKPIDLLKSVKAMRVAELKETLSRRVLETTGGKTALCTRLVSDMLNRADKIFSREEMLAAIFRLDVVRRLANYGTSLAGPGRRAKKKLFVLYVESGFNAGTGFWCRFGLTYQTFVDLVSDYKSDAKRCSNSINLHRLESIENKSYSINVLHHEVAKSSDAFLFDKQAFKLEAPLLKIAKSLNDADNGLRVLNESWSPPRKFGLANAALYTVELDPKHGWVAEAMVEPNKNFTIDGLGEIGKYSYSGKNRSCEVPLEFANLVGKTRSGYYGKGSCWANALSAIVDCQKGDYEDDVLRTCRALVANEIQGVRVTITQLEKIKTHEAFADEETKLIHYRKGLPGISPLNMIFPRTREEAVEAARECTAASNKRNSELAKNSDMSGEEIKWTVKDFQKLAQLVNVRQNDRGGVNDWSPVIAEMCEVLDIPNDGPKGSRNRIARMWGNLNGPKGRRREGRRREGRSGYRVNRKSDKWVVVKC
ncbi:hypothetical protein TeGR_g12117 [Tetraparma gracilis]|uniref:SAP domain-containing protein n=1 Tax=Tetraparma gracilis TaxID=2962635 RepID=A0ABQ6M6H6_9STRA|nr:hypothetical protein TeGR_g12117 [Tetraparma gracilis]